MKYYTTILKIRLQEINNSIVYWLIEKLESMIDLRKYPMYPRNKDGKFYPRKDYIEIFNLVKGIK